MTVSNFFKNVTETIDLYLEKQKEAGFPDEKLYTHSENAGGVHVYVTESWKDGDKTYGTIEYRGIEATVSGSLEIKFGALQPFGINADMWLYDVRKVIRGETVQQGSTQSYEVRGPVEVLEVEKVVVREDVETKIRLDENRSLLNSLLGRRLTIDEQLPVIGGEVRE